MAPKSHDEEKEPVTKGDCKLQHKSLSKQLWTVFSILTLLMVAIGWSWDVARTATKAGDVAEKASGEVKRQFDIHDAKQGAVLNHIGATLERIEEDVKEQRKLVEQMHRNGHSP